MHANATNSAAANYTTGQPPGLMMRSPSSSASSSPDVTQHRDVAMTPEREQHTVKGEFDALSELVDNCVVCEIILSIEYLR